MNAYIPPLIAAYYIYLLIVYFIHLIINPTLYSLYVGQF